MPLSCSCLDPRDPRANQQVSQPHRNSPLTPRPFCSPLSITEHHLSGSRTSQSQKEQEHTHMQSLQCAWHKCALSVCICTLYVCVCMYIRSFVTHDNPERYVASSVIEETEALRFGCLWSIQLGSNKTVQSVLDPPWVCRFETCWR